jgi:hypothetical protein
MKKISLLLIAALCICACRQMQIQRSEDISPVTARMYTADKNVFELYSWQQGGQWNYALINAKTLIRSFESITSAGSVIYGSDELIKKINSFPKNEDIYWNLTKIKGFSYPPHEKVLKILEEAKTANVVIIPMNY